MIERGSFINGRDPHLGMMASSSIPVDRLGKMLGQAELFGVPEQEIRLRDAHPFGIGLSGTPSEDDFGCLAPSFAGLTCQPSAFAIRF